MLCSRFVRNNYGLDPHENDEQRTDAKGLPVNELQADLQALKDSDPLGPELLEVAQELRSMPSRQVLHHFNSYMPISAPN